jgi:hypothetical protein
MESIMGFLKDLAESQIAVDAIVDHLIDRGIVAHELEGKREQKNGDVRYYPTGDMNKPVDLEIKFDKMSRRTNNMCFELSNSKGPSGISKTKADKIVYVCPTKRDCYDVYVFDPSTLKEYLHCTSNVNKVKIKSGGDRNRFKLAIVKIQTIIDDKIFIEMWSIDNA